MRCVQLCVCLLLLGTLYFTTTFAKGHSHSSGGSKGCSSCKTKYVKKPTNKTITPPKCSNVTERVYDNLMRKFPCDDDEDYVGYVVVNPRADTKTCVAWSPLAYWDGFSCMGRCELLGGVEESYASCTLNGTRVNAYQTQSSARLFVAPIRDGTWLGERDSAWSQSWFNSTCVKVLESRWGVGVPETKQTLLVPSCREGALGMCGIMVPCPECDPEPFLFSQALYSAMGVHNCGWAFARDILMLVGWAGASCLCYCCCCACQDHGECQDLQLGHCNVFLLFFVVCVWEFALAAGLLGFLVWTVLRYFGVTAKPHAVQPEEAPRSDASKVPEEDVVAERAFAVSEFRKPVDVAAVSIDFPVHKALGWKHV